MALVSTITSQALMSAVRVAELKMKSGRKWRERGLFAQLVVCTYAQNSTIAVASDPDFVQNVRDALIDFPDSLSRFNKLIGA